MWCCRCQHSGDVPSGMAGQGVLVRWAAGQEFKDFSKSAVVFMMFFQKHFILRLLLPMYPFYHISEFCPFS